MYAIVEIAGQQFKVEEGKKIFVHRLDTEIDKIVEFDRVLLVEDNDNILVGEPAVDNFIVEGKVIDHVKGDKVIVFKKKRKKGYRIKNGHRQRFSQIEIVGIGEKGKIVRKETPKKEKVKKAPEPEIAEEPLAEKKPAVKKSAAKKAAVKKEEAPVKTKKTAEKKAVEKKPAAKKASKKKE
ncbi:MAG: 50S ribosomal protein L21 [Bacteroidetes bacterium RBG_13_42_15]|jgi:large subunit ribosomal protein L21|nr:MAG: 50S ribosomal protein L21 [Bacteroidetes bacterium RBG_13_42_15]